MTASLRNPVGCQLRRDLQIHEPAVGQRLPDYVAVTASESRTADHGASILPSARGEGSRRHPLQPRQAIVVVQGLAGRHLGDTRRRMEIVAFQQREAERPSERRSQSRFARTGDAHNHDVHVRIRLPTRFWYYSLGIV